MAARSLPASRIDGLAAAGTASYLSGTSVFQPPVTLDGIVVSGAGTWDVFLARYDLSTGTPLWARAYGDELEQFGTASTAPTADGTVALIGRVGPGGRIGTCSAGPPVTCSGVVVANRGAYEGDFLLLLDAGTGDVKAGTQVVDNGEIGQLNAVAAEPSLDLLAVCGAASATSTLCRGTTPASCTEATPFQGGNADLLVALLDSSGALRWARQVGGSVGVASDETCNAVAVAPDGTVWAAGGYREGLDLGTGPLPTLPNRTNTRHMWLAHFGRDGSTLAVRAFGTLSPTPAGVVLPRRLAIDSAGNLVVAGSFTASFPVGNLVSAGVADAFVAKFSPDLRGLWAVRLGNEQADAANGVAITASDDVIAVGEFSATVPGGATTGAAALTAPRGNTAAQAFILKLDGATGATLASASYGDASPQIGSHVAVGGEWMQFGGTFLGTLDLGAAGGPLVNTDFRFQGFTVFARP
jgi:hypothetical protein